MKRLRAYIRLQYNRLWWHFFFFTFYFFTILLSFCFLPTRYYYYCDYCCTETVKTRITYIYFFVVHVLFCFRFTGERPYRCHLAECGRAFIQLSNLQQHLRNHDAQVERAKNRPFHCTICGKGFATESSLRTHTAKVRRRCFDIIIYYSVRYSKARVWCLGSV